MPENSGKLSPEQVKRLASTISEAKELTSRQAEIIEKVLKGETDIGEIRISYQKTYFDTYFKGLDAVARKCSQLADTFLILEEKADKHFQQQETNIEELKTEELDSIDETEQRELASAEKVRQVHENIINNDTRERLKSEDEITDKKIEDAKKVSQFIENYSALFYKNEEELENELAKTKSKNDLYEAARDEARRERRREMAEQESELERSLQDLYNLRHQDEIDRADQITSVRLAKIQEVTDAEKSAQSLINSIEAEIAYAKQENYVDENGNDTGVNEAGALAAKKASADALNNYLKKQEDARAAYIARKELEAKRKNNGILSKEAATQIQKEAAEKFKLEGKNLEKLAAKEEMLDKALSAKDERDHTRNLTNQVLHGETTSERFKALKEVTTNEAGEFDLKKSMTAAMLAVSDLAKQIEGTIDEIASFKGPVDTRLQGSNNKRSAGSYWDQLVKDMTSVGAINPYFKQKDFAENIKTLVNTGIAFDLKQRAFLMTIQDKIATTFDVANGTLLRLVRIQQEDSTAGRLGMESALNSFLNNMYENTEYLKSVAEGVRSSLEEMESLMSGAEATEVEYQVQKWLGSLYSVGMSQSAVNSIATAFGQIAAGQIEGLTNGGAGNLLIMAANDAGLSIADMLIDGLNASDTNKLLQATVNYLAELAESAKDNQVVQQQLADVFGVKASDLKAATNLVLPGSVGDIYGSSLTYDNMISQLVTMASTMGSRTSMAEMMSNFWENGKYTLAGGMASNPVSYFIYKMAKVLDDAAGGIDLPFLNVMGFGVDLNTTVSDLMRVAAVGGGILGSLGPIISGLGSSFSGKSMLEKLGISAGTGLEITPRGGNSVLASGGGSTTSGSGYVGNSSGSDIKDSTIQEANDSKKQQMIEAKEEEESNQVDVLNNTVIKIYELLDDVASGKSSFKVKVEGYGLTKANGGSTATALGGLSALDEGTSSGGTGGGGSATSGGVKSSLDLGGWTMA